MAAVTNEKHNGNEKRQRVGPQGSRPRIGRRAHTGSRPHHRRGPYLCLGALGYSDSPQRSGGDHDRPRQRSAAITAGARSILSFNKPALRRFPGNACRGPALSAINGGPSMKRMSIILGVLLASSSLALAQGAGSSGAGSAGGAASTGSSTSTGSPGANSGSAVGRGTTGSNMGATTGTQSPPSPGAYNPTSPTGNTDTGVFKK